MAFLELRTPQDMLEKAKREHARLLNHFDIDHVFNFFITANHIRDYIEKNGLLEQAVVDAFYTDQDVKDGRDLCDKAKHLRLTKRADPRTNCYSGAIGGAPVGVLPVGGSGEWELWSDDRVVNIESLAGRLLRKWEAFLDEHEL